MKKATHIILGFLVTSFACAIAGNLNPPDGPSPTMHTLEEIYDNQIEILERLGGNTNSIPAGMLSPTSTVVEAEYYQATTLDAVDADFIAENIRSGVTLFGITGTFTGQVEVVEVITNSMVYIPGASFTRGDFFNEGFPNERPLKSLYIDGFYMAKYEVTKDQWDEVYNWAVTNGYSFDNPGAGKGINHPVHSVNWYDATKWANARSEKEGLTPSYYTNPTNGIVYRAGQIDLTNDSVLWDAGGYRLPTEAEWEKAARGGTEGMRFPWSDTNIIDHTRANYEANSSANDYDNSDGFHPAHTQGGLPYTSPVGTFPPNDFGLFNMAGNIQEMCWDWIDESYYNSAPQINPRGPDTGNERSWKGGICSWNGYYARVSDRHGHPPSQNLNRDFGDVGFRLIKGTTNTITTGLVAYYPLDGDTLDASGNGHNGTGLNVAYTAEGAVGGAYSFNGVNSRIQIPHDPAFLSGPFSVITWIKTSVTNRIHGPISKAIAWTPEMYRTLILDNGDVHFSFRVKNTQSGSLYSSFEGNLNQWTMITTVYTGSKTKFYVNQNLVGEAPFSPGFLNNNADVLIGAGAFEVDGVTPTQVFDGFIDEVRIYDRPLAIDEVEALFLLAE